MVQSQTKTDFIGIIGALLSIKNLCNRLVCESGKLLYLCTYENVQIKTSYVALNFLCFYLVLIWTFSCKLTHDHRTLFLARFEHAEVLIIILVACILFLLKTFIGASWNYKLRKCKLHWIRAYISILTVSIGKQAIVCGIYPINRRLIWRKMDLAEIEKIILVWEQAVIPLTGVNQSNLSFSLFYMSEYNRDIVGHIAGFVLKNYEKLFYVVSL